MTERVSKEERERARKDLESVKNALLMQGNQSWFLKQMWKLHLETFPRLLDDLDAKDERLEELTSEVQRKRLMCRDLLNFAREWEEKLDEDGGEMPPEMLEAMDAAVNRIKHLVYSHVDRELEET